MMIKGIIILITILLLFSCAQSTTYQRKSFYQRESLSFGYSEQKISASSYQISFKGNESTSREQVNDFALLRAAEVTLKNGYQYLTVLKTQPIILTNNVTITRRNPSTIKHESYVDNNTDMCRIDNNGNIVIMKMTKEMARDHKREQDRIYRETTWEEVQEDYLEETLQITNTIEFLSDNNQDANEVYNANEIISKMSKKYQLKL